MNVIMSLTEETHQERGGALNENMEKRIKGSKISFSWALIHPTDFLLWGEISLETPEWKSQSNVPDTAALCWLYSELSSNEVSGTAETDTVKKRTVIKWLYVIAAQDR